MERKHKWVVTNCWTIYRCEVCRKCAVINFEDEKTTDDELLKQKLRIFNRTDCSGVAYK